MEKACMPAIAQSEYTRVLKDAGEAKACKWQRWLAEAEDRWDAFVCAGGVSGEGWSGVAVTDADQGCGEAASDRSAKEEEEAWSACSEDAGSCGGESEEGPEANDVVQDQWGVHDVGPLPERSEQEMIGEEVRRLAAGTGRGMTPEERCEQERLAARGRSGGDGGTSRKNPCMGATRDGGGGGHHERKASYRARRR